MSPTPFPDPNDEGWTQLAWYAQRKPVFTGGNEVRLLRGGDELFPDLRASIDRARSMVWMAFYMLNHNGLPGTVLEALMRAARRGVTVHLVVDGVGSRDAPQSVWDDLRAAGVQLEAYRPVRQWWGLLAPGQWRRMHVKLCVIDQEVGYVGGINLIDDRFDLGHGWCKTPRLDYAVAVKGPAITPVVHTVRAMWTRARVGRDWRDDLVQWGRDANKLRTLKKLWRQTRLKLTPREQNIMQRGADTQQAVRAAFVLRDNLRQRRTIELAALAAIKQAKHRIDIVTPYFYPRRAIRLALRQAAARGVKVRLLLQGKADYQIASIAARVLYAELQRFGVSIHEYQAAFLHAKVLVVDDDWATVGSSNLDPLSLVLNLEANLIVRDRAFVTLLSERLEQDFQHSHEVSPRDERSPSRLRRRVGRAVVSWLAKTYLRLAGATGRY